ncbi:unnamed protein product, partial [Iphiclides podalirius]
MANAAAIVMALSLLINDVTFLHRPSLLDNKHFSTQIVYILSVCLLLHAMPILPKCVWRRYTTVCFLIEIAISLAVLECSLVHAWNYLEHYMLSHADDLLLELTNTPDLEWLVCQFCSGKSDCSETFGYLLLKMLSFLLLLTPRFRSNWFRLVVAEGYPFRVGLWCKKDEGDKWWLLKVELSLSCEECRYSDVLSTILSAAETWVKLKHPLDCIFIEFS